MKLKLLLVLTYLSAFSFAQTIKHIAPDFNKTSIQTNILYTPSGLINISNYQNSVNHVYSFQQAYKAISFSDFEERFQNIELLKKDISKFNNNIPLGIIITEYETIKPEFQNEQTFIKTSNTIKRLNTTDAIFDLNTLEIASVLKPNYKGLKVNFELNEQFIFNTTNKTIQSIEINFNDGLGFVPIQINQNHSVNYTQDGDKLIQFKITFSNNSSTLLKSKFKVKYSSQDYNKLFNMAITTFSSTNTTAPNLTPYGVTNTIGTAEYDIYLSNDNVLDKPIFLVDGFDPGDTRDIPGLYSLLDFDDGSGTQNLGDVVGDEGFDIVILNFPVYTNNNNETVDGGADFIERNAMLLVELINIINEQKIGNDPNVIIGPSMGGLISRYALNFMENQGLNHDTRLYISFDSPHLGANVPIGFQHMFNYLAYGLDTWVGDFSVDALKPVVDGMLKSPAARQMLTDQFEMHLQSGEIAEFDDNLDTPTPHPYFNIFYSNLNSLTSSGFPETVRNVSIINGSGLNRRYNDINGNPILPGRKVLDAFIQGVAFLTDAYLDAWYTTNAGQSTAISDIWIDAPFLCFCDIETTAYSRSFNYSNGIDAASGGLFNLSELAADFGGTDPLIDEFLGALQTNFFNFIPSVSAMALENNGEINWFHTIDIGEGVPPNGFTTIENNTPFINWFMPDDNEDHVTLTPDNVAFALDEILLETLNNTAANLDDFSLEQNPITNNIVILSKTNYSKLTLSLYDVAGRLVTNQSFYNTSNRINMPITISSGIYMLQIESEDLRFNKKIVVQ